MVKRQPGRPSEETFVRAASRFLANDYEFEQIHLTQGYIAVIHNIPIGRSADVETIRQEYSAEGVRGERESIRDFALHQLAAYQKLHND